MNHNNDSDPDDRLANVFEQYRTDDQTENGPELGRKTGIEKTQRTIERLHALANDGEIEFIDPKGGSKADTEGGDS